MDVHLDTGLAQRSGGSLCLGAEEEDGECMVSGVLDDQDRSMISARWSMSPEVPSFHASMEVVWEA